MQFRHDRVKSVMSFALSCTAVAQPQLLKASCLKQPFPECMTMVAFEIV